MSDFITAIQAAGPSGVALVLAMFLVKVVWPHYRDEVLKPRTEQGERQTQAVEKMAEEMVHLRADIRADAVVINAKLDALQAHLEPRRSRNGGKPSPSLT